jgi:hypothetical protein
MNYIGIQRLRTQVTFALLLSAAIWSAIPAQAQIDEQVTLPARITQAIDESSLVTLHGNTHPMAQAVYDRGPAPVSMPASRLLLVLTRSTQQEAELQTWLQSVQDPNSPNYRKWLTPEQFGKRYGVSDADLAIVQAWLQSHGFTVNKVAKGRMAIEFSGTVGQVQTAFHAALHSYSINDEQHWANATDPQIPSALTPVVAGLAELNNFVPKAQFIRGPSGVYDAQKHTIAPAYTTGNSASGYFIFLGPADAATIYDTPTTLNANLSGTAYDGTGVTIGVAGDSNIDITQNANYRSTFGLPAKATTVVVDGNDPGENGDAIEAYLDTQVAGGIAPNANVILYTAAGTDLDSGLFLAVLRALDDNQADILNVSFGGCETALGSSGNQYILNLWEQAAAQGISVTVSSGDSGSAACDNLDTEKEASNGLAVNGLASTPFNISVGGTDYDILYSNFPTSFSTYVDLTNTLPKHRSALKYIPEEPWNDSTLLNTDIASNYTDTQDMNIIAGGGGISSVYPVPTWQASVASGTGRNLPDVSLLAGNGVYGALWGICTDQDSSGADCAAGATGNNFNLTGVGGTSAAAPAFAGMLALVKQQTGSRLGQADDVLYNLAKSKYEAVFHDVTTGDNSVFCALGSPNCTVVSASLYEYYMSGYNATAGYDEASGLGSVDTSQLLNNWAGAGLIATNSSLQLNGATAALNITHGQSVTVSANVASSGGTPSGNIALVDSLSPANQPNSEGIAGFTLTGGSASGATNSLPGGAYEVSAHYGGSSTFAESDSNAIPVTVGAESSTTTVKVSGYYDPATGKAATTPYYGFIYLIDAQPYGNSASAANPNGAATGTITFKSGSTTLGTAALASDGIAELQTASLPGGSDSITAAFPGDASFLASTSAPVAINVTPAVTSLGTPSSQPFDTTVGSAVTLSVTLTADSAGATPTGTVSFMNGSTALGSVQLVGTAATATAPAGGAASFATTSLPTGTNSISAVYSGDGNYGGSTSPSLSVFVLKVQTSLTMTPASPTAVVNQPLQVTITPTPGAGLPLPTGSVTMYLNSALTASANLVNGAASVTIPANTLPLGTDNIVVEFSGDNDYQPAQGILPVTVNSSGTIKPTVTVTAPTSALSLPVTVTVSISGPSGDPVPTGSVSLSTINYYQYSMPLTNGSATFVMNSGLVFGPNTLTVTYLGDSNYTSGSGTATVNLATVPYITFAPYNPTIAVNQPLNMTVTVATTANVAAPTGTITLSSGNYTSSAVQLTAGAAIFTIPANSLAIGSDTLTATYSGDANYLAGSNAETVTVTAAQIPGLALTATSVTIGPGSVSGNTSTITLTPSGGFTGSVALTAAVTSSPAGASDTPTLSFGSTSPVSISGTAAGTATLTIFTTAPSSAALIVPARPGIRWYNGGAALACFLLFGVSARRRRRWRTMLGLLVLLAFLAGSVLSCGGGGSGGGGGGGNSNPGTTPGAYTVTVTGTSGSITATGTVTLTVQ